MLLGVMLLYVGAVLVVNGIWLVGQTAGETSPLYIQNREVAVLNLFTGFVGIVTATTLMVQGNGDADLATVRGGGLILLFAFTYLWVAANNFLNAGGRAFGWYCLFVAITALPAGYLTLDTGGGADAAVYLGICWFAWAVLWFVFFLLLALERPVAKLAGGLAVIEGIATCWIFGFLLLWDKISF